MSRRCLLWLLPLALVYCGLAGCGAPPQWGADEGTFKHVDALWTAITAQDVKLVDQCAENITKLHNAGRMPEPAFAYLQDVIAKARSGQWSKARDRLKKMIRAQRRE